MKLSINKVIMTATILMMVNVSHADTQKVIKKDQIFKALIEQMSTNELDQVNALCESKCTITITPERKNKVSLTVGLKKIKSKDKQSILVLPIEKQGVFTTDGLSDLLKLLRKKDTKEMQDILS